MKKLLVVLFVAVAGVLNFAESQTRVFVQGSHGYKYVSGVAQAIPNLDAAGHDQTMELAKTFLQRCPSVRPTVNKEKADFYVTLNWTEKTRFFIGGKVFHKPDQIIVENRDGDILYSGIARSVGGDVEGACRTIENASRLAESYDQPEMTASIAEPTVALGAQPAAAVPSRERVWVTPNAATSIPALGLMVTTRDEGGVRIVSLATGGMAELAHMHVGDVINGLDGKPVRSAPELVAELSSRAPGTKIRVGYMFRSSALDSKLYFSNEAILLLPQR